MRSDGCHKQPVDFWGARLKLVDGHPRAETTTVLFLAWAQLWACFAHEVQAAMCFGAVQPVWEQGLTWVHPGAVATQDEMSAEECLPWPHASHSGEPYSEPCYCSPYLDGSRLPCCLTCCSCS